MQDIDSMRDMLVTDLLIKNSKLYAEEEALAAIDSKKVVPFDSESYRISRSAISWRRFNEMANQTANYLNRNGIGPGQKVAVVLMNCLEWLPIYFGILKSGAVAVPLNFRYLSNEIVRRTEFVGAEAIVFGARCAGEIFIAMPKLNHIHSFIYVGKDEECPEFAVAANDIFKNEEISEPCIELDPEDDAAIYFSSGTTGAPKAVVYTHGTLRSAWQLEHGNHLQVHKDTFVLIPPLYHVGGKLHWFGNLPVGARCVMLLGFCVDAFFEALTREKITIAFLLLPWVQDILCKLDAGLINIDRYPHPDFRLLHLGAQHIPPIVIKRLEKYFPELSFGVSYGLTESGGPGCLNLSSDRMDKLGSVGLPPKGWQAMVIDKEGRKVSAGKTGELLIKGPKMMRCYYNDPIRTADALDKDGWLHTSDLARYDEDGFYYIVGRIKDIIISGGENIYPNEIEEYIRTNPLVRDAAVFGVCDERLGEAVAALIEPVRESRLSENDIEEFCRRLPKFQRPRHIYLGTVPRNPTGKIDKKALRLKYAPENPFEIKDTDN